MPATPAIRHHSYATLEFIVIHGIPFATSVWLLLLLLFVAAAAAAVSARWHLLDLNVLKTSHELSSFLRLPDERMK